jgi:CheY-like chemotaxis protein
MENFTSNTYRWPALPPGDTSTLDSDSPLTASPSRPLLGGLRIVVAEADPATLCLIVHTIGRAGAAVFPAYDARTAVELCMQIRRADLLIASGPSELLDGAELIRRVRADVPSLAFLYIARLTALGWSADAPSPPEAQILREPFSPNVLLRVARGAVERRRAS